MLAAVVVPFVGEPDCDAVRAEGPDLFDETVVELARPLAGQECNDVRTPLQELGAVSPVRIGAVGQRDL